MTIAGWNLGKVQEITWNSSKDGRKIYGVLVLPPDYKQGTPHKVIVHAHASGMPLSFAPWISVNTRAASLMRSNRLVLTSCGRCTRRRDYQEEISSPHV